MYGLNYGRCKLQVRYTVRVQLLEIYNEQVRAVPHPHDWLCQACRHLLARWQLCPYHTFVLESFWQTGASLFCRRVPAAA